jgi:hypothetical protein
MTLIFSFDLATKKFWSPNSTMKWLNEQKKLFIEIDPIEKFRLLKKRVDVQPNEQNWQV